MFSSNALYLANKSILMSATKDGPTWGGATIKSDTPPDCAIHALNYVWRPKLPYTIRRNSYYFSYPLHLQAARRRGRAWQALPAINHEPPRWAVVLEVAPGQLDDYMGFVASNVAREQRIYYLQKAFYGWQMQASRGLKHLQMAEVRAACALAEQSSTNKLD